VESVEMQQIRT